MTSRLQSHGAHRELKSRFPHPLSPWVCTQSTRTLTASSEFCIRTAALHRLWNPSRLATFSSRIPALSSAWELSHFTVFEIPVKTATFNFRIPARCATIVVLIRSAVNTVPWLTQGGRVLYLETPFSPFQEALNSTRHSQHPSYLDPAKTHCARSVHSTLIWPTRRIATIQPMIHLTCRKHLDAFSCQGPCCDCGSLRQCLRSLRLHYDFRACLLWFHSRPCQPKCHEARNPS